MGKTFGGGVQIDLPVKNPFDKCGCKKRQLHLLSDESFGDAFRRCNLAHGQGSSRGQFVEPVMPSCDCLYQRSSRLAVRHIASVNDQLRLASVPDEIEFGFQNDWFIPSGISRRGLTQQVCAQ